MTNRDKYKIIRQILESLPAVKSNIMCKAEINFYQCEDFIYLLERNSIIYLNIEKILHDNGKAGTRNLYYISKKGCRLLEILKELERILLEETVSIEPRTRKQKAIFIN